MMCFSHLGGIEKRRSRIAKCPERFRTRAFMSLEGFRMYTQYGRVGAIPTYRVYRLSDMLLLHTVTVTDWVCGMLLTSIHLTVN